MGLEVHHRPRKNEPLKYKSMKRRTWRSHHIAPFATQQRTLGGSHLSYFQPTQHPFILSEAQRSRRTPKVSTPPKPLEPFNQESPYSAFALAWVVLLSNRPNTPVILSEAQRSRRTPKVSAPPKTARTFQQRKPSFRFCSCLGSSSLEPTQHLRHPERSAAKPKDPEGIGTTKTARTFQQRKPSFCFCSCLGSSSLEPTQHLRHPERSAA
jgi:hypothetical protein